MKEKRGVEEKCEIVGLLAKFWKSNLIPLLLLAIGVRVSYVSVFMQGKTLFCIWCDRTIIHATSWAVVIKYLIFDVFMII